MDAPYDVQLTLPALVDSARLARLVAAGLAADAGWTMDDTEDLRIAVSELVALLVENDEDPTDQVSLHYQRTRDSIEVTGRRPAGDGRDGASAVPAGVAGATVSPGPTDPRTADRGISPEVDDRAPDDLALEILRVVVDEHDFTRDGSARQFRILKRGRKHP